MPPTTTMASGRCDSRADPGREGRRQQAEDGRQGRHRHRPHQLLRALRGSPRAAAAPAARSALNDETSSSPFMMATPRIEMKPTAAEMLKLRPGQQQRPDAAQRHGDARWRRPRARRAASGTPGRAGRRSAPATATTISEQPPLGLLHLLELAAPLGAVGGLDQRVRPSPGPRPRCWPGRGRGR